MDTFSILERYQEQASWVTITIWDPLKIVCNYVNRRTIAAHLSIPTLKRDVMSMLIVIQPERSTRIMNTAQKMQVRNITYEPVLISI